MTDTFSKEARKNEESLYEKVAEEIERKEIKKGLWAKALSESSNDKIVAEGLYIKLRTQSLKDEMDFLQESEFIETRRKVSERRIGILDRMSMILIFGVAGIVIIISIIRRF